MQVAMEIASWNSRTRLGMLLRRLEQRIDDGAFGNRATVTLLDHSRHRPLKPAKILYFASDFIGMLDADVSNLATCVVLPIDEIEQRPDFLERESQLAASTNEEKPLYVLFVVKPVAARAARRGWHEMGVLVVADRLDVAVREFR